MIFYDTSYLVRLYLDEPGSSAVRDLAKRQPIAAAWHAQAELLCTFHRALREGRLNTESYRVLRNQFYHDQSASAFEWLTLSESTLTRLDLILEDAPANTFLRAADALYLACAAEHGFRDVYSNDRHFLAAASLFGLKGINLFTP
ncbi:MAG: type II toxin-antitoxin system VapC family toxin [Opitutales bacterium]|nr:type II toxin-antitoxin system VapC family toxin [Opitutales bacterium]